MYKEASHSIKSLTYLPDMYGRCTWINSSASACVMLQGEVTWILFIVSLIKNSKDMWGDQDIRMRELGAQAIGS